MDISKIKELTRENRMMNKELNNSGAYKNEFIANVTHELKTPINGIQGMVETLMEPELSPKQLEIVNIIHRCCRNMTAIITDILDFSKIKNNKMELEYREFSFHEFIENIKTMNQKRISKKGLRFLVNIADDVPDRVIGDELRLSQVLNNLISNAIKFTSVGQIILGVMKTEETNREVELIFMVTDTGIGISEDEMDKLFISFSQVDGTITRRFGGTGLGLSICKMLIELMKGHITVKSEKNKGSSFSFTIRLGVPEQDTTAANDKENELYNIKEVEIHLIKEKSNKLLEEDYISKFLDKLDKTLFEADKYDNGGKGTSLENSSGVSKICSELIEKMIICIELECWEQAERLAEQLKRILAKQNITIGQKVFRLLLAVRREDYKTSLLLANELKEMNTKTHGQSNI